MVKISSSDLLALTVASAAFIDGHHLRFAILANGFAEEAQDRCGIPFSRQQKVGGLTFGIDRPVQIFPLPLTLM